MSLSRSVIGRSFGNVFVLIAGLSLSAISVLFSRHGLMLVGLGAFFIIKGASKLPCKASDVLLSIFTFGLLLLSKTPSLGQALRLTFELSAVLLTIVFVFSGLSLRSIMTEQRRARDLKAAD